MAAAPWILISVLVLLILIGVVVFLVRRKNKTPPDYYAFFVMGIIWTPFGIATGNYAFFVIGLVFMITGLVHKKKWKQNRRDWSKLDKSERNLMMAIMIGLGLMVLAGLVFFLLAEKGLI